MAEAKRQTIIAVIVAVVACLGLSVMPLWGQAVGSRVVEREIQSKNFAQNKIGTSAVRKLVVYLPAGYDGAGSDGTKRYPVIYFLPNPLVGYRDLFDKNGAQALFDRAVAAHAIGGFVFVSVDMTTPLGSSWYVNSPVTGNWEDFVVQELVPYMDANFRTLAARDSRGIAGDFMGGYGAIRFGMKHPEVFGSVYALHPVGTGSGVQVMYSRPNWDLLANATSLDDVKKDGFSTIFTSIFQAHLPDVDRPPLFIDLQAHKVGDRLVIDTKVTERLRENFFIESMVPRYADNLKSLRGFKFDWSRNDTNMDHIYSNQALTHKLNEFGVPHEAEEYNGSWGDGVWGKNGRMAAEVLPFFERCLVF
ncbi:putative esterase [Edaphobacter aggregans]|uniref:Putative esterase n=1 Tax=Edaphobacter aggregans TaxID=570835 RepID=A0A3R9P013_9BACT|nr:alpha/beta hydrolase-fold protein [Edaphobacter aggregans]RSL17807.1 putative esterase [Edaphobacter aggregans]